MEIRTKYSKIVRENRPTKTDLEGVHCMVSQTSILVSVKIISIISMQNYLKMSDYSFSYNPPPQTFRCYCYKFINIHLQPLWRTSFPTAYTCTCTVTKTIFMVSSVGKANCIITQRSSLVTMEKIEVEYDWIQELVLDSILKFLLNNKI